MTRAAWESPPDSAFSGPALARSRRRVPPGAVSSLPTDPRQGHRVADAASHKPDPEFPSPPRCATVGLPVEGRPRQVRKVPQPRPYPSSTAAGASRDEALDKVDHFTRLAKTSNHSKTHVGYDAAMNDVDLSLQQRRSEIWSPAVWRETCQISCT